MKNLTLSSTVKLNNGIELPYLGLGVFQTRDGVEVVNSVKWAINAGYKLIDTAKIYGNEKGVGIGIKESGIDRKEIFLTTKVWNSDQGYDNTLKAFDESLRLLNVDYLDLYLIHWPVKGKYKDTWKALEYLYEAGKVRAIGVSNFLCHHLEDLLGTAEIVPMVNQIEYHPYLTQPSLIEYCKSKNIQVQSWSPLMQGRIFEVEQLVNLAQKYNVTPAQLVIRWNLQNGIVTIPKSIHEDRIMSNCNVFNFNISEHDMGIINNLDRDERVGPDPDHFDF